MKNNILFVIVPILILVGITAIVYFVHGPEPLWPSASPTETAILGKLPKAECSIGGVIKFRSASIFENQGAVLMYANIDSSARHIIWIVSPSDKLSVGPNLFASLGLPNGSADINVGLPERPKARKYTLRAKVTYGVFEKDNLVIKEADCSGNTSVELAY